MCIVPSLMRSAAVRAYGALLPWTEKSRLAAPPPPPPISIASSGGRWQIPQRQRNKLHLGVLVGLPLPTLAEQSHHLNGPRLSDFKHSNPERLDSETMLNNIRSQMLETVVSAGAIGGSFGPA
jgi:hypothetical protein